ncbi:MAG: hypothetical protein WCL18_05235 [bacterium]
MYQEIGERDNAYLTLLNHDIKGERRDVYERVRKDRGREEYLAKNKLLNEKRGKEENEFHFNSS